MTEEDHLMLDVDVSKGEKIFNYKTFRQEHFVSVVKNYVGENKDSIPQDTHTKVSELLINLDMDITGTKDKRIGLFGGAGVGKSSFWNQILNTNILPKEEPGEFKECSVTVVPTEIFYSPGKYSVDLILKSESLLDADREKLSYYERAYENEDDADEDTTAEELEITKVISDYDQYLKLGKEHKNYSKYAGKTSFSKSFDTIAELSKFVFPIIQGQDGEFPAAIVSKVYLSGPFPNIESGTRLLDLPGHTTRGYYKLKEFIGECDTIFIMYTNRFDDATAAHECIKELISLNSTDKYSALRRCAIIKHKCEDQLKKQETIVEEMKKLQNSVHSILNHIHNAKKDPELDAVIHQIPVYAISSKLHSKEKHKGISGIPQLQQITHKLNKESAENKRDNDNICFQIMSLLNNSQKPVLSGNESHITEKKQLEDLCQYTSAYPKTLPEKQEIEPMVRERISDIFTGLHVRTIRALMLYNGEFATTSKKAVILGLDKIGARKYIVDISHEISRIYFQVVQKDIDLENKKNIGIMQDIVKKFSKPLKFTHLITRSSLMADLCQCTRRKLLGAFSRSIRDSSKTGMMDIFLKMLQENYTDLHDSLKKIILNHFLVSRTHFVVMAKQCLSLMNIQVATRHLEKTQPSKMAHSIEVEKELISTEPEVCMMCMERLATCVVECNCGSRIMCWNCQIRKFGVSTETKDLPECIDCSSKGILSQFIPKKPIIISDQPKLTFIVPREAPDNSLSRTAPEQIHNLELVKILEGLRGTYPKVVSIEVYMENGIAYLVLSVSDTTITARLPQEIQGYCTRFRFVDPPKEFNLIRYGSRIVSAHNNTDIQQGSVLCNARCQNDTYVFTAAHLFPENLQLSTLQARFGTQQLVGLEVERNYDIAAMRVPRNIAFLDYAHDDIPINGISLLQVGVGSQVQMVKSDGSVSYGVVENTNVYGDINGTSIRVCHLDGPHMEFAVPGDSGSAVLDDRRRIIGMVRSGTCRMYHSPPYYTLIVPIKYVHDWAHICTFNTWNSRW